MQCCSPDENEERKMVPRGVLHFEKSLPKLSPKFPPFSYDIIVYLQLEQQEHDSAD